jgi:hypothetical protein
MICKFGMVIMGYGISHKDTKHTDKCGKKKHRKQNDEIRDKYFFKIL